MLTGSVPFEGENTRAILFKQMMESPRSMRELVPEVPETLMATIAKGMAKEPADRYPDIEAFSGALEAAGAVEVKPAVPAPVKKQRKAPLMLAGAATLATVAIAVALFRNGPAAETPRISPDSAALIAAGSTAVTTQLPAAADSNGPAANRPPAAPAAAPAPPPSGTAADRRKPATPAAGTSSTGSRTGSATIPPASNPKNTATCQSTAGGDDRDTAFRLCTSEAESGNVVSQRLLAGLYDRSQVPGHDAEAVVWYRKAADAGDLPSLFRLGQLLQMGKGVPQNALDATAKIKQAAESDYQPAFIVLAQRYEQGIGVPRRSDNNAYIWYLKAAERGDVPAQAKVGDMLSRGKGIDKDEAAAVTWFQKAADRGNRDAQYGLGMAYLRGRGVQKSDSLGYALLKKAADQGHVEAQKEVAKRKN
jgi:TPR repeat protein